MQVMATSHVTTELTEKEKSDLVSEYNMNFNRNTKLLLSYMLLPCSIIVAGYPDVKHLYEIIIIHIYLKFKYLEYILHYTTGQRTMGGI